MKNNLAVIFGDIASFQDMYTCAFKGRFPFRLSEKGISPVYISLSKNAQVTFIPPRCTVLDDWPGGNLIWVLPARGPSEIELLRGAAVMEQFSMMADFEIEVLFCIPPDYSDLHELESDLDRVAALVESTLPEGNEAFIQVVWLKSQGCDSAAEWFHKLKGDLG